jgi:Tfp pilus assembly protein PilW
MNSNRARTSGFGLVELMIAIAAGLVVALAAVSFMVTSLKSNSDFVKSTRLTQQLRFSMGFVSSELRRAGYDQKAITYSFQPLSTALTSDFSPMLFNRDRDGDGTSDDACVIYAYDRSAGTDPGKVNLASGEIRGLRLVRATVNGVANVGVIEMGESAAGLTPTCADATADYSTYPPACTGGWCAVSDPRTINITAFTLDVGGIQNVPATSASTAMQVRDVNIVLSGNLIRDASVVRSLDSSVRVRADCMKTTAACGLAPVKTGSD